MIKASDFTSKDAEIGHHFAAFISYCAPEHYVTGSTKLPNVRDRLHCRPYSKLQIADQFDDVLSPFLSRTCADDGERYTQRVETLPTRVREAY